MFQSVANYTLLIFCFPTSCSRDKGYYIYVLSFTLSEVIIYQFLCFSIAWIIIFPRYNSSFYNFLLITGLLKYVPHCSYLQNQHLLLLLPIFVYIKIGLLMLRQQSTSKFQWFNTTKVYYMFTLVLQHELLCSIFASLKDTDDFLFILTTLPRLLWQKKVTR